MRSMAQTEAGTAERPEGLPDEVQERRRRRSPVLAISLFVSVLIHLALLLFYPLWVSYVAPEAGPPLPPRFVRPEGTEVILIREVAEDVIDLEPQPEPFPEVTREELPQRPGPEVVTPEVEIVEDYTPAERLRPTEETARLWAPVDRELTDLTPEERLQLEIEISIDAWNDSVAAEIDAARAATDWTTTDASGNRWGISPGKLHLGKVTLPLPIYFGPSNGVQRDELAKRAYELGDIERGASSGAVRETLKERAKAIRQRRDAERAQDGGEVDPPGGGSETPPDTTRGRN
jgi:hypothetical protein